jgi:TetR/AcrR family transcriptional repressor of nem operon
MAKVNDKRTRLIEAANTLFHQEGVTNTTLAKIADLANVPLGNVYYYFKTKEAIILAVVDARRQNMDQLFQTWEQYDPKERLVQLLAQGVEDAQGSSQYGDALGSLCLELSKQGGNVAQAASQMMNDVLDWAQKQFVAIGKKELSKSHALNLVSSLQGMSLLSATFKSPDFITTQSDYLRDWLETIPA